MSWRCYIAAPSAKRGIERGSRIDWDWRRDFGWWNMRVLVGCEYSGRVRRAFMDRGHDAWSCDLLESEDGSPHHVVGSVLDILDEGWDLAVFHPPCTYLAVSGLHWNSRGVMVDGRPRAELTEEALDFVRALMAAPIERIALENPVSCISSRIRKPDQIIQPWWFGEDASKKTCLWLKNLPHLVETNRLPGDDRTRRANQTESGQNKLPPSPDRWKERSRTYEGIAQAMADQWGAAGVHGRCGGGKAARFGEQSSIFDLL